MDLAVRWHRLLRALAFILGLVLGLGLAVFIFSNTAPVNVHWTIPSNGGNVFDLNLNGVSLWLLAIVPLVLGGVVGYFYQTPARMHHVREHLRHRSRVHELEHELKELRLSLDKVLMMPEDGSLAVPAALMPPLEHRDKAKVAEVSLPEEPAAADLLDDFPDPEAEKTGDAAQPAAAAAAPARKRAASNGARGARAAGRRPRTARSGRKA
jgi:hypothetical protein